MDKKIISIEKLLQTPVCMMSGEELAFLFNNLGVLDIIDKAISQLGRKIVIDVDLALELAAERKEENRND